jgi:hypothetical protein
MSGETYIDRIPGKTFVPAPAPTVRRESELPENII